MQKARTISPFLERENDDVYNIFIIFIAHPAQDACDHRGSRSSSLRRFARRSDHSANRFEEDFGARVVSADSRGSEATSVGIQKGFHR
jgi:hypothetical protein